MHKDHEEDTLDITTVTSIHNEQAIQTYHDASKNMHITI